MKGNSMENLTREQLLDLARRSELCADENEQRATDALNQSNFANVKKYSERAAAFRHTAEDFQRRAEAAEAIEDVHWLLSIALDFKRHCPKRWNEHAQARFDRIEARTK